MSQPGDVPSNAFLLDGLSGTFTMDLTPYTAGWEAVYGATEYAGWLKFQAPHAGLLHLSITGPAGWVGVIEAYERSHAKPPYQGDGWVLLGASYGADPTVAPAVAGEFIWLRLHPFNTDDAVTNAQLTWDFQPAQVAKFWSVSSLAVTEAPGIIEPPRVAIAQIDFTGAGSLVGELGATVEDKIHPEPIQFGSEGTLAAFAGFAVGGRVTGGTPRIRRRWRFHDSHDGDSWEMPMNPKEMTSPHAGREFKYAHGVRGGIRRMRVFESPHQPVLWEFSGVTYTKQHYEKLLAWTKKDHPVEITDHLDRTFRVVMQDFVPADRRNGRPPKSFSLDDDQRWRNTYTIKALILRRVS